MLKYFKITLTAAAALFFGFTPLQDDATIKTIVIDPGHGGKDAGCIGSISKEKNVVLDLSIKLANLIKSEYPNVRIFMTRKTDKFIDLDERAKLANRLKADLFISIHCNAIPKSATKSVYGTETFTLGRHKTDDNLEVAKRENSVILQEKNYKEKYGDFNPSSPLAYIKLANRQNAYVANSVNLATKIEKYFKSSAKRSSRGVKQAGFLVLVQTTMPSVLIEAGFLSNKEEERFLNTEDGQDAIAESIFRAFQDYKNEIEGE